MEGPQAVGPCPEDSDLRYHSRATLNSPHVRRTGQHAQDREVAQERRVLTWGFRSQTWSPLNSLFQMWGDQQDTVKMQFVKDELRTELRKAPEERDIVLIAAMGPDFLNLVGDWLKAKGFVDGTAADPGEKAFFLTLTAEPTSRNNRGRTIDLLKRGNAKQPLCVLASIPVCKAGLNLQPCSYTIIVDVPWTYADLTQLTGRTIRMGQERIARIAVLLVEGTFEMTVWTLVEAKREMTVGVYSGLDVLKQTYSIYTIDDKWILGMFDLAKPDPALTGTS
ncbi:hypothetical protein FFLO_05470 [Filobasidium floriforme]|uniref:Helicase C-terminal domain-containing protein n=1 Tax=Filobasidium floriforme TaxID=5210 RepID=A0A8K0JIH3_9TREE|nr:hypothetical protein FFLO_05470 [Filobasidium floriforme]